MLPRSLVIKPLLNIAICASHTAITSYFSSFLRSELSPIQPPSIPTAYTKILDHVPRPRSPAFADLEYRNAHARIGRAPASSALQLKRVAGAGLTATTTCDGFEVTAKPIDRQPETAAA
jgi:hypothetical protein